MSAIARYLHSLGANVYGYDKTETHLTQALEKEGITVGYVDDVKYIPEGIDLVIYTPAIPKSHKQYNFLLSSEIPVIKRAKALGWISQTAKTIAVAGTHGKTTTSSMVAQMMKDGQKSFSAFLGGISYGLGSNYINNGDEWIVVEADEYDRSFLHLSPDIAILLSMDADHLDIYGDHQVMKAGFWDFILKIKRGGKLIFKSGLEGKFPHDWQEELRLNEVSWVTFGAEEANVKVENVRVEEGRFVFDYTSKDHSIMGIVSGLPGRHNLENASAALTVGHLLGIDSITLSHSLEAFQGIFRRFDRLYEDEHLVYIDDYAHHPTELNAAITAARELYPEKKLMVVFQPHLFSRTRDFVEGFAEELSKVDELILMEIYPAREEPIPGITSEIILSKVTSERKDIINDHEKIIDRIKEFPEGVILTLGAGDIDLLRNPIIKMLSKK